MKRSLRHPLLDRDSDPGAPRIAAKGPRQLWRSQHVRLPVVPSAFTAKNDASLRQEVVKRSCSTGLSYGPPDLGPAGFEPATSSLEGCSSTCIRNATSKTNATRGGRTYCQCRLPGNGGSNPMAPDVVLPAFASNFHSFRMFSSGD